MPESERVIVLPLSDTVDLVRPVPEGRTIVKLLGVRVELKVLVDVISKVGLTCPNVSVDVDEITGAVAFAAVTPTNEIPDAISKTAVVIEKNFLSMMLSFNL